MDLTQREVQFNGDGMLVYRFSFAPAGTSTADTLVGGKYVQSVKRTATAGVYTVLMASNFAALLGFRFGIRDVTAGGLAAMTVQLDPVATNLSAAGGAQIVLRCCPVATGASGTDFTAAAGSMVDVELTFGSDPNNLK